MRDRSMPRARTVSSRIAADTYVSIYVYTCRVRTQDFQIKFKK